MKKIEDNNTLVFIVDPRANKQQIKAAVSTLYQVLGFACLRNFGRACTALQTLLLRALSACCGRR